MPRTSQALLADFATLSRQLADATAFRDQLQRDVATATDALDLTDEKAIAALQTKKTQLELAPRKLAQLEERRAALAEEVDAIVTAERSIIGDLHRANFARLTGHVATLLLPFCADRAKAEALAGQTTAAAQLRAAEFWSSGINDMPPAERLHHAAQVRAEAEAKAKELAKLKL